MNAYSNAKLMLTMYTYELAESLQNTGVTVNVVEPGSVATNIGRNSGSGLLFLAYATMRPFQISAKKGSETIVYLASGAEVEGVTGKCFSRLRETTTAQVSYDQQMRKHLWDVTMRLLGLTQA
jgi:NAD(P)-dependent dehydrogenase (short-subunit alcohol dehydrogenase family)